MISIEQMVAESKGGLDPGWAGMLYQSFTDPILNHLPSLRDNTLLRLWFLENNWPIPHPEYHAERVLDIGCSNGAISLGLALRGYDVIGWDTNEEWIAIAREAHCMLEKDRLHTIKVKFEVKDLATAAMIEVDTILYLSVFKWVWRVHGKKVVLETLRSISENCNNLVFESGVVDGPLSLIPLKRDEVGDMLVENTNFKHTEMVGCFPRDSAHNVDRDLWICRNSL